MSNKYTYINCNNLLLILSINNVKVNTHTDNILLFIVKGYYYLLKDYYYYYLLSRTTIIIYY
jgi:hypothetical protein